MRYECGVCCFTTVLCLAFGGSKSGTRDKASGNGGYSFARLVISYSLLFLSSILQRPTMSTWLHNPKQLDPRRFSAITSF
ncbi:hypothetical protein F4774DRAFT_363776 [Daldinia eschscholtzii]|nr:hypothetical protein F4774DRAFT_363776 [Daldinia eschscholtzii]